MKAHAASLTDGDIDGARRLDNRITIGDDDLEIAQGRFEVLLSKSRQIIRYATNYFPLSLTQAIVPQR